MVLKKLANLIGWLFFRRYLAPGRRESEVHLPGFLTLLRCCLKVISCCGIIYFELNEID